MNAVSKEDNKMITNWVAPGEGATVQELRTLLGFVPRHLDGAEKQEQRTNLAISSTGTIEDYDRQRFAYTDVE
jgi:hypothetical protein